MDFDDFDLDMHSNKHVDFKGHYQEYSVLPKLSRKVVDLAFL